jgi:hypothetical protein
MFRLRPVAATVGSFMNSTVRLEPLGIPTAADARLQSRELGDWLAMGAGPWTTADVRTYTQRPFLPAHTATTGLASASVSASASASATDGQAYDPRVAAGSSLTRVPAGMSVEMPAGYEPRPQAPMGWLPGGGPLRFVSPMTPYTLPSNWAAYQRGCCASSRLGDLYNGCGGGACGLLGSSAFFP